MNSQLTYRDFVSQIVCAIVCNILIAFVFRDLLTTDVLTTKIENEFLWTLVAIPILMVEGHLIWAIDNLIFVTIITNKHKYHFYEKHPKLFHFLFGHRILYYSIKEFNNIPNSSKTYAGYKAFRETLYQLNDDNSMRHESLSDLFKALCFVCVILSIIACIRLDWIVIFILAMAILCYFRAKKYARLYMKDKMKMLNNNNKIIIIL